MWMMWLLLITMSVAVLAIVIYTVVAATAVIMLPKARFVPVPGEVRDHALEQVPNMVDPAWLDAEGFDQAGVYARKLMNTTYLTLLWKHAAAPVICDLQFNANGQVLFGFTSKLGQDLWLNSTNSTTSTFLPEPPGLYQQAFPDLPMEQLWEHHLAAEVFVKQREDMRQEAELGPLDQEIKHVLDMQARHVRNQPLWWLRLTWWYFVRRPRLANKSVQEQIDGSWQVSPS